MIDPTRLSDADISRLPPHLQAKLLPLLQRRNEIAALERARSDFYAYCQHVEEKYVKGTHLELITSKLQAVAEGRIKRLVICMPPRHSKSRHGSELFPSYYLGHQPDHQVMLLSHTLGLAKKFGRSIRGYMTSPRYAHVFPETKIRKDQSAVGEWGTTKGAQFFAAGVGGAIAGRGANLLLLDDLVDEQTGLQGQTRPEVYNNIYDWYKLARQRLQPDGAIVVIGTRWAPNDPIGQILENSEEEWEIINLPAIWPKRDPDDEDEQERVLWPEYWSLQAMQTLRAEMPPHVWASLYQQDPTSGGSTIVEADWIQEWPTPNPPKLTELIITIDGAFSEKERADPSGILIGGIFEAKRGQPGGRADHDPVDRPQKNAIVIDYMNTRQNFPDLKTTVMGLYQEYKPDAILIEDKASGVPLFQDLSLLDLPVSLFKVSRGTKAAPNDKIARYTGVSAIIKAGRFWVPHREHCSWSESFQSVLTKFPMVTHDEEVDCTTMFLTYFRNLGELTLPDEMREKEDNDPDAAANQGYKFGGYQMALRRQH
jgi:predicted phage terminase large subunit-like protein